MSLKVHPHKDMLLRNSPLPGLLRRQIFLHMRLLPQQGEPLQVYLQPEAAQGFRRLEQTVILSESPCPQVDLLQPLQVCNLALLPSSSPAWRYSQYTPAYLYQRSGAACIPFFFFEASSSSVSGSWRSSGNVSLIVRNAFFPVRLQNDPGLPFNCCSLLIAAA